jgi:hypothetical protein
VGSERRRSPECAATGEMRGLSRWLRVEGFTRWNPAIPDKCGVAPPLRQPSVFVGLRRGGQSRPSEGPRINQSFRTTGVFLTSFRQHRFRSRSRRNDDRERTGMESGQPRALG